MTKLIKLIKKEETLKKIKANIFNYTPVQSYINAKNNSNGMSALMYAVKNGNVKAFKLLLSLGADVNAQNNYGDSVLMIAIQSAPRRGVRGSRYMVKQLIKYGANVNVSNIYGYTPLMCACLIHHAPIVDTCLEAGADINSKTLKGLNALDIAKRSQEELAFNHTKAPTKLLDELNDYIQNILALKMITST
jgi:ankyrin repeat protein